MKKIIYAAVILLWIATMSALISKHYHPSDREGRIPATVILPEEFYGDKWMGVYFKDKKIGYVWRKFEKAGTGYKVSETAKMTLTVMGSQKEIETETYASLAPDLSLTSFNAAFMGDADLKINGEVNDNDLRLTIETAGVRTARKVRLKDRPSLSLSLVPKMLREGIRAGRKYSIWIIDPSSLTQEQVPVEITGREEITSMNGSREAFKLRGTIKGADFFIWLTEKGDVLREESPMGFTLIREKKEEALRHIGPSADLTQVVSVPFHMKLPSRVRYMKVRVSGIDPGDFELEGGGQHIENGVVEIRMENITAGQWGKQTGGDRKADARQYLRESAFVQSRDPRILSLAREIVKEEKDRIRAARRIHEWVYGNIRKVPSVTFPSAVEVLKTKKGDCNEHTALFTALSRAAGIPTRMSAGLVYKEGNFYYHAWPEIFSNRWVAVDPTLGQFPADASHIRLITGDLDAQLKLVSVIGKIQIEGLAYR